VVCKHVFTAPIRACRFASSVVTPWGYKAGGRPCTNLSPLAAIPVTSFSAPKKERQRDSDEDITTLDTTIPSIEFQGPIMGS
jgi:hypothetical protein